MVTYRKNKNWATTVINLFTTDLTEMDYIIIDKIIDLHSEKDWSRIDVVNI